MPKIDLGFRDRSNPLFFTNDAERGMDLRQACLAGVLIFFMLLTILIGLEKFRYTNAGYAFIGSVMSAAVLATLPLKRAKLWARMKGGSVPADLYDDERGDYTEREPLERNDWGER